MALALTGTGTEPGRKSLVIAAVLPLLSLLDVFILPHSTLDAFGVRLAWAVELVFFAWVFERSPEPRRRPLLLVNSALGTLFYLGIVHVTGGLASPFLNLVPTLPLVVAFVYPEEVGAAIASGIVCMVGIVGVFVLVPEHRSQVAAWLSMAGSATFFGVYGSAQFRKALLAQSEIRMERARREALEKLALAEHRRAQSEKLATVGRLAAGVVHEINNPLSFVRSNLGFLQTEVLAQPLADEMRGEIETAFSETRSGVERIRQIVMDLKGFSRMDVEDPLECDLAEVVADATRLAEIRLKYVARLTVEVPTDLPKVFATPRRLAQVVLNLLVNAGDSLEDTKTALGEVWVRGEARNGRVMLLVEDNGPGFPPEVLPRLFEPFFTTKGPEQGTGLGLSISRELVERFGGTLRAENRPEGGARLCIELPALSGSSDDLP